MKKYKFKRKRIQRYSRRHKRGLKETKRRANRCAGWRTACVIGTRTAKSLTNEKM